MHCCVPAQQCTHPCHTRPESDFRRADVSVDTLPHPAGLGVGAWWHEGSQAMKATEAYDVATTAGSGLRHLTKAIKGAHLAISDTVHDGVSLLVGPAADPITTPIKVIQDVVTKGVYAATDRSVQAAAMVTGYVATQRLVGKDNDRQSVHDAPAAHSSIAVLMGLYGDRFAKEASTLAPKMHLRTPAGRRLEPTREGATTAYPIDGTRPEEKATGQIAVFLHGLFETEAAWRLGSDTRETYAVRLASEVGLTPVMVRYNTGLRISDNGLALSELLEELVAAWPVPVERMVLIGHSMGGLVLHSALLQSGAATWPALVSDTVSLGSPHHGSPVARGVHRAAEFFGGHDRGEWLADVLRLRSVGIRDLNHGNVVAEDWRDHHPDDLTDRRTHAGLPEHAPHIRHHAVVGVATKRVPDHLRDAFGDFMVPAPSARHAEGDVHPSRFADESKVAVVTGVHHLALLNHPKVHGHLVDWLVDARSVVPSAAPQPRSSSTAVSSSA